MLKRYLKLSIIWTTILTTLSTSSTFAGNWLAMPGLLQRMWYEGILQNGNETISFWMKDMKAHETDYSAKNLHFFRVNLLNDFWLEKIWNFYRGIKKFDSSYVRSVELTNPWQYHYNSYSWTQEGGSNWRTWSYGVWEAQWWKYNLYDANGSKWGDCVPYYISGSNRVNRIHNGGEMSWNSHFFYNPDRWTPWYTAEIIKDIQDNTTQMWNIAYSFNYNQSLYKPNSIKFFTPNFISVYAMEELWMQMYIPYVTNEMWQRQSKINLISNAWHLNGELNPEHVNFTFSFY